MVVYLFSRLGDFNILGDGFSTSTDRVPGQPTIQEEADSGVNLSGCDSAAFVIPGQEAGFHRNEFEDAVDE